MENKILKPREILISLALKYEGDWDKITEAIKAKEKLDEAFIEEASSTKAITLLDAEYPTALRQCYKPPIVLFYEGDISLMRDMNTCVAYVGSRNSTPYGNEMARTICQGLAKEGFKIVSGLARGIDTQALASAVNESKAIAVLGNGIGYCYPSENTDLYEAIKAKGLVISEYPKMTKPTHETFPMRNRIVAGLSKALVVGEASRRSGTMITVNYALSYNRDVGCVPFRATEDSACNSLIKEGAFMVESVKDVLDMLGIVK